MKTQNANPAFLEFQDLLAPDGRYPVKHVDFCWNADENNKIKELEAIFIPRSAARERYGEEKAREFWGRYEQYNRYWNSDLGNSLSDWPNETTPESIFGFLLWRGFASPDEQELALEEFACVVECEWAREMLRGFRNK